jgi:hypothetical protein
MAESAAYARRGYLGAATATTLSSAVASGDTSITADDLSTWTGITTNGPARFTITDGTNEEEVEFTGISTNTFTGCTRGVGGTNAQAWSGGESIKHTSSFRDFDEANKAVNQTLGLISGNGGEFLRVNAGATALESVPLTTSEVTGLTEFIQDAVGAMATAGTGITATYDDTAGTETLAIDTTAEAERIRDVMGVALVAGTGVTITPSDPGDTITVASISTGLVVSAVVKAADESVSASTTLQADDELTIAVAANSVYQWEALLVVDETSATPDFKFQWNVPASTTGTYAFSEPVSVTSASGAAYGSPFSVLFSAASTYGVRCYGVVRTAGTAGNLALSWAQNTSNATAATVKADSYIKLTKVS